MDSLLMKSATVSHEWGVEVQYKEGYKILHCEDEGVAEDLYNDFLANPRPGVISVAVVRRVSNWGVMKVSEVGA